MRIEIVSLSNLPEVRRDDDLAALIRAAATNDRQLIDSSVVVAVAQKIVSKAEGAVVDLRTIQPSPLATSWAKECAKDPRLIELVLSQSKRIVKMDGGVLVTETHLGHICANAGVDQSNVEGDHFATVLPLDPDRSASRLRTQLNCGAVIITDTFGRPWREGLVDVAIGVSGLESIEDIRGSTDRLGRKLSGTIIAVADQLAAAAGILMRKSAGCPVVLLRGFEWKPAEGSSRELMRAPERNLFR